MSLVANAATPVSAVPAKDIFADLTKLAPCHIKAIMALKDQHPNALIVSDEFLKVCRPSLVQRFQELMNDPAVRKDGYIEVGVHNPKHHKVSVVSDLHFQTICRRPRSA